MAWQVWYCTSKMEITGISLHPASESDRMPKCTVYNKYTNCELIVWKMHSRTCNVYNHKHYKVTSRGTRPLTFMRPINKV